MAESALFLAKKFLGNLLMPVSVTLFLLLTALLLLLRQKTRWLGFLFVFLDTALLFVSSYSPLSNRVVSTLEMQVPCYQQNHASINYVVVLGSCH